ncbi:MAG: hypothetical protein IJX35_02720, partial [Candidatus Methanomethylophilaceae archaeon]|nr:hypothetical protein [Candidatus Methanomethylophilaceae archaeon]
YLTQDDTDVGPRTSEEVGDYIDIGVWNRDGNYTDSRLVLIGIEDGEHTYAYIIDGVFRQSFTVDMELIVLTCLPPEGKSAGTGLVQTLGGFYECDAVKTEKGTFYVCDGMNVKMELKDRTVEIYGTSLTEKEAPVCGNLRQDVREGDFVATSETIDDITMVTITSVREMDGDKLTIDLIMYTIGPDGTTVDRDSYVTETGNFLSTVTVDQSFLADGWTTDNRIVCLPMAMSSVPAVEYVKGGSAVWMGAADNTFLCFESDDVEITLIGTSLFSDVSPVYDRSPVSDLEKGESMIYNDFSFRILENGLEVIDVSTKVEMVLNNGDPAENRPYDIVDIIRVEVVDTPMGPKLCAVTHGVKDGAVIESTFDVFSGIEYMEWRTEDGITSVYTLSQHDGVVNTRDPSIPVNGDMTQYLQVDDKGDTKCIEMCMFEFHGLHYVSHCFEGGTDWGFIGSSGDPELTETISTEYGELECGVLVYDFGNGNKQTAWIPLGWAYPVKYLFVTPDSSWTMDLQYTSSNLC